MSARSVSMLNVASAVLGTALFVVDVFMVISGHRGFDGSPFPAIGLLIYADLCFWNARFLSRPDYEPKLRKWVVAANLIVVASVAGGMLWQIIQTSLPAMRAAIAGFVVLQGVVTALAFRQLPAMAEDLPAQP